MTLPLLLTHIGLFWERLVNSKIELIISPLFFFQLIIVPTKTKYFAAQALTYIPLSKSCNVLTFSINVFSVYFLFPLMVRFESFFFFSNTWIRYSYYTMKSEWTVKWPLYSRSDSCRCSMTHSQLLEGLKCESKWKTAKGGKVGARSLVHNILRGRGACWSSGMGLGRVDKFHSLTRACTQPT